MNGTASEVAQLGNFEQGLRAACFQVWQRVEHGPSFA